MAKETSKTWVADFVYHDGTMEGGYNKNLHAYFYIHSDDLMPKDQVVSVAWDHCIHLIREKSKDQLGTLTDIKIDSIKTMDGLVVCSPVGKVVVPATGDVHVDSAIEILDVT